MRDKRVGADIPPTVQQTYESELGIGETLRWGSTITPAEPGDPTIHQDGSALVLSGQLAQFNADGSGSLQFGESIILFKHTGGPSASLTFVQIRTTRAVLYDANI